MENRKVTSNRTFVALVQAFGQVLIHGFKELEEGILLAAEGWGNYVQARVKQVGLDITYETIAKSAQDLHEYTLNLARAIVQKAGASFEKIGIKEAKRQYQIAAYYAVTAMLTPASKVLPFNRFAAFAKDILEAIGAINRLSEATSDAMFKKGDFGAADTIFAKAKEGANMISRLLTAPGNDQLAALPLNFSVITWQADAWSYVAALSPADRKQALYGVNVTLKATGGTLVDMSTLRIAEDLVRTMTETKGCTAFGVTSTVATDLAFLQLTGTPAPTNGHGDRTIKGVPIVEVARILEHFDGAASVELDPTNPNYIGVSLELRDDEPVPVFLGRAFDHAYTGAQAIAPNA